MRLWQCPWSSPTAPQQPSVPCSDTQRWHLRPCAGCITLEMQQLCLFAVLTEGTTLNLLLIVTLTTIRKLMQSTPWPPPAPADAVGGAHNLHADWCNKKQVSCTEEALSGFSRQSIFREPKRATMHSKGNFREIRKRCLTHSFRIDSLEMRVARFTTERAEFSVYMQVKC